MVVGRIQLRAQERLKANRECLSGRKAARTYLLNSLVRCGRKMTAKSNGLSCFYYACSGRDSLCTGPHCDAPWIPAKPIEHAVWDAISTALKNPGLLLGMIHQFGTSLASAVVNNKLTIEFARKPIEALVRRDAGLLDIVSDREYAEHHRQQARQKLQESAKQAEGRRAEIIRLVWEQTAYDTGSARRSDAEHRARAAARGIDRLNQDQRQELLIALVDRISVESRTEVEIQGLLPCGELSSAAASAGWRSGAWIKW